MLSVDMSLERGGIARACRRLIIHVHEHDPDTDNRSLVCDSMRHDRISARTHAEGMRKLDFCHSRASMDF